MTQLDLAAIRASRRYGKVEQGREKERKERRELMLSERGVSDQDDPGVR
jgi:hypothetical protein